VEARSGGKPVEAEAVIRNEKQGRAARQAVFTRRRQHKSCLAAQQGADSIEFALHEFAFICPEGSTGALLQSLDASQLR
jgi:hypothetical protein